MARSMTSSPDGIRRCTGSAATVPASTTTLTLCYYVASRQQAASGPVDAVLTVHHHR
jgi:hypothetical protein